MKIWTNKIEESWIMDRVISEWENNNKEIITDDIKSADIIWISSYWVWKKIRKQHLKNKKVMCSIYHIDFESFDKKQEKDFYKLDSFVDEYHVISLKTKDQYLSQVIIFLFHIHQLQLLQAFHNQFCFVIKS